MECKINWPNVVLRSQIDCQISKLKEIDALDFLILNLFYSAQKDSNFVKKDMSISDAFINKLNVQAQFHDYLLQRIIFFLNNQTLVLNNQYLELKKYINELKNQNYAYKLIGDLKLNQELSKTFDEQSFHYLDEKNINKTFYYFDVLTPNYKFLNKKQLIEKDIKLYAFYEDIDLKQFNISIISQTIKEEKRQNKNYLAQTENIDEEVYDVLNLNKEFELIKSNENINSDICYLQDEINFKFIASDDNKSQIKILKLNEQYLFEYFLKNDFDLVKTILQKEFSSNNLFNIANSYCSSYLPIYLTSFKHNDIQAFLDNKQLLHSIFNVKDDDFDFSFYDNKLCQIAIKNQELNYFDQEQEQVQLRLNDVFCVNENKEIVFKAWEQYIALNYEKINWKQLVQIQNELDKEIIKVLYRCLFDHFDEIWNAKNVNLDKQFWLNTIDKYNDYFNKLELKTNYIEQIITWNDLDLFKKFIQLDAKQNKVFLEQLYKSSLDDSWYELVFKTYQLPLIKVLQLVFINWKVNKEIFNAYQDFKNQIETTIDYDQLKEIQLLLKNKLNQWNKYKNIFDFSEFDHLLELLNNKILTNENKVKENLNQLVAEIRSFLENKFNKNRTYDSLNKALEQYDIYKDKQTKKDIQKLITFENHFHHNTRQAENYKKENLSTKKLLEWTDLWNKYKPILDKAKIIVKEQKNKKN